MVNMTKIGLYIQELRKQKGLTQVQIAERLNISSQAVSKWERGETLPDTVILMDLAIILETSVDNILYGGEKILDFNYCKKMNVKDIKRGIESLSNLGNLIGKTNSFYIGIIDGVNTRMNLNLEDCLSDNYKKEALISEVIIQNIQDGVYVDLSDIKANLEFEHWINIVCKYAFKYGIK